HRVQHPQLIDDVEHDRKNEDLADALPAAFDELFAVHAVADESREIRRPSGSCIRQPVANRKERSHERLKHKPELHGATHSGQHFGRESIPDPAPHVTSIRFYRREPPTFLKGGRSDSPVDPATGGAYGTICGQCCRTANTRMRNAENPAISVSRSNTHP